MRPQGQQRERLLDLTQVIGLLVLVPVGAELLAAYADSTGHLGEVLFAVVFSACLYGAPALLIRDVVRRNGWGWPSLLLLCASLGILQAAVIDQSLFSLDYGGNEGFRESAELTWFAPLGVSAFNVQNFLIGHVVFSFAAPLALAEAWRPSRSMQPWLGLRSSIALTILYLAAAALILTEPGASGDGNPTQIGIAVALAVVVGLAAVRVGQHRRPGTSQGRSPTIGLLLVAGGAFGAVQELVPPTWLGTAISLGATAAAVVAVLRWSAAGWTPRHTVALAAGVLFARGLSALTSFPLLGDVSAASKYLHNITMLVVVVMAWWAVPRVRQPQDHATAR